MPDFMCLTDRARRRTWRKKNKSNATMQSAIGLSISVVSDGPESLCFRDKPMQPVVNLEKRDFCLFIPSSPPSLATFSVKQRMKSRSRAVTL
jgi:hypothetical protein